MASKRQIGAIIKLDGEHTFKIAVQNCRGSISALKSELKNIQSSYAGNANSLEALSAVQEKYAQIQERARENVSRMAAAYEKSQAKEKEVKNTMQQMADAYEEAEKELKKMKQSGEASADAIAEQSTKTEEAYHSYQDYAEAVERCEQRTTKFRKALADASTAENDAAESVKKYRGYIEEAQKSADGHAKSIDKMGKKVSAAGTNTKSASDAMGVFKGALASGFVTQGIEKVCDLMKEVSSYAVEVGSEFEAAMSKVKAISGATGADFDSLKSRAEELGRSTQFSASDVSNAFSYMALAGWDVSQMLQSIDGVLNLAAAGEMDLAEASDIVTDYISAFGLTASDSSHFVDMMATAMSSSNTNIEQLGEAYKNCASTAGQFGYSAEEATAALMTMANAGVKGSEAGTALNALMVRLATNTKGCSDELQQYGVSIYDSSGNMQSLSTILSGISDAFSTLNDEQQANLAKVIAGQNQYSSFLTVLQGMSDAAKENGQSFEDYTKKLTDCDGAASGMAKTMNDNLKGRMQEVQSAAEGLGSALYDYVDGPLSSLAEGAAGVLNKITDALKPQKNALDEFIESATASVKTINANMKTADLDYNQSMTDASKIREYINVIDECRSKTTLTQFEQFKLNNAVQVLSQSIPGLNEYIGDTNKLLTLSDADFKNVRDSMTKSYDDMMAAAIAAKRNAYVQAQADSDIAYRQAQSALENATNDVKQKRAEIEKLEEARDNTKFGDFAGTYKYTQKINDANESLTTLLRRQTAAEEQVTRTEKAMKEASAVVAEYDENSNELYSQYGLYINQQGELTSKVLEQKAANEEAAESTERVADAYAAMPDRIKSYMSAAAESVTTFRDSLGSSLQSFSFFGDRDSIMDIYTQGRTQQLQAGVQASLYAMKTYTSELENLQKRGISQDFLQYLTSQGQSGLQYVHTMAAFMSDDELKVFQQQWDEFQSYIDGTNEHVNGLMDSYTETVMDGIDGGYDTWHQYGVQTVQGLFDAIQEAQAQLESGDMSGSIGDAFATILQNRRSDIASSVQQTKANTAQLNPDTSSTKAIPLSQYHGDITVKDKIFDGQIIVNVDMDGENIVSKISKMQKNSGKITGRR